MLSRLQCHCFPSCSDLCFQTREVSVRLLKPTFPKPLKRC